MTKKRKQHPPRRDDASTVSATTCRVGRGEQAEAHPAMSAPNRGRHLNLGHLRLKTWSNSNGLTAETKWAT